jgi:hypothetical protein
MAIAQMNWGQMRHPLSDPKMKEFADQLDAIYRLAEEAPGFIWRINGDRLEAELSELGYDEKTSATVSVWQTSDDLYRYTYESAHGVYLDRAQEWFEAIEGPQLVIWPVENDAKPSFFEAHKRLEHMKEYGPSDYAHGCLEVPGACATKLN